MGYYSPIREIEKCVCVLRELGEGSSTLCIQDKIYECIDQSKNIWKMFPSSR